LSLGKDAKVVEPASLQKEIKKELEEMLDSYRNSD
jgi:predicted DNA-binding transcriptional regulator YafY